MPHADPVAHGEHVMTVCNACRYCEQFCPVFPAMERRLTFAEADLAYLASLCHNCGECLYACQYAPPHEFGINVPRTMAEIRAHSYEAYCWPSFLSSAFRQHNLLTGLVLAAGLVAVMAAAVLIVNDGVFPRPVGRGDFYGVLPHDVMVALFGGVGLFSVGALWIGVARFWRDVRGGEPYSPSAADVARALSDVLTLRHLQGGGADCTSAEEQRAPFRRWFHHCTFYGFLLCFASTSMAALYHLVFGWLAPYGYGSVPVLLGMAGGAGLIIGPAGLLMLRGRRDQALGDPDQRGMDESFVALLLLTSLTGFLLLAFRDRAVMSALLVVHLGAVLALFVTLPYGKFVHGIYRTAALMHYAMEIRRTENR
ncbi:MAG: tricarballylate utilization 4Fe-4S protein TcuB [Vicinamibacterales bacterium]